MKAKKQEIKFLKLFPNCLLINMPQHRDLATGRWNTMTLAEQLGNIGSDFERALRWKEKGQEKLFESAVVRTLELIDLTLADQRWHNYRLKEIARLRDEVCSVLFSEQPSQISGQGLQKYFLSMAISSKI